MICHEAVIIPTQPQSRPMRNFPCPEVIAGNAVGFKETYKVHLDGYNLLPYLTGEETKGPRKEFFYFSDDGDLTALRFDNWKLVFAEQRAPGTLRVWSEPFTHLRVPLIYNLRLDPYERANKAGRCCGAAAFIKIYYCAGRLLLRNFALPPAGECAALVVAPSSRAIALHPAHRPELHDFDGGLRDLEMRVAFECLRGRFVRLGLDDGGQDDVVARVGDAGGGDALGFSGHLRAKIIAARSFIHASHSPLSLSSAAFFSVGSVSAQPPITATGMRNRTRNFFCSLAMGDPSVCWRRTFESAFD